MTSIRQRRVGELLRHEIAQILLRDDFHHPTLNNRAIIVSQVDIAPDFSHAKIFVETLGGKGGNDAVKVLNQIASHIRKKIKPNLHIRRMPRLQFMLDESFEKAATLHHIINQLNH